MYTRSRQLLSYSLIISFLILLLSAADGRHTIQWDENTKLTWANFKDTLITGSNRAAETYSGFKMDFAQSSQNSATITIYSEMDPARSWVDSTKKNDYLLSHEQYHFNITEYWTRKLRQDILATRFTTKNLKETLTELRKETLRQSREMQKEYDADTKHSLLKDQQKKWEKRIDELLKETEKYTDVSINISIK